MDRGPLQAAMKCPECGLEHGCRFRAYELKGWAGVAAMYRRYARAWKALAKKLKNPPVPYRGKK